MQRTGQLQNLELASDFADDIATGTSVIASPLTPYTSIAVGKSTLSPIRNKVATRWLLVVAVGKSTL